MRIYDEPGKGREKGKEHQAIARVGKKGRKKRKKGGGKESDGFIQCFKNEALPYYLGQRGRRTVERGES